MGVSGYVEVYELADLEKTHKELHGRELKDDWHYAVTNSTVNLGGVIYLLNYWGDYTDGTIGHAWCMEDGNSARDRVATTLELVAFTAAEVWT